MSSEFISAVAVIVSLFSFLVSYKSYNHSKATQLQAIKAGSHVLLSEWRSKIQEIQWESLFVEREIDGLLVNYPDHAELLMWRIKTEKFSKLSKITLSNIGPTREAIDNFKSEKQVFDENIGITRGKHLADEALTELRYIRKALDNFDPDNPKYYRGK